MKKITKPAEKEESIYYSDFSGKCFGEWLSPVEIKIEFNYGSKYDGAFLGLHLDDEDVSSILEVIKNKMSIEYSEFLKKKLKDCDNSYYESVQFRDWDSCAMRGNSIDLLNFLLNVDEK